MAHPDTAWHIVTQHQTTELSPAGTFHDVMEIIAESNVTGTYVTVRIPLAAYTPEYVAEALNRRFRTVHAVAELGE